MFKSAGKIASDAVAERLKTPLIATFIFSWLIVNHSFALEFMFESLENKVAIAKAMNWDWQYSLIYPSLVTFAYVLIVPALQLGLDWIVLNTLGEWRKKHDSLDSRNKAESSQAHQAKLLEKDLVKWEQEREELKREVQGLANKLSETEEKNQKLNTAYEGLKLYHSMIQQFVDQALESLEKPKMHAGSDYEDQRTREEVCDETIAILEQIKPNNE